MEVLSLSIDIILLTVIICLGIVIHGVHKTAAELEN